LAVTAVLAIGFTKLDTEVQLGKLLDQDTDLIHDYAWLESHLGNLAPLEVVLTVPPERCRTADEHAEQDGRQYRLTMLDRLNMLREIQARMEQLPEISRVLSVATFTPEGANSGYASTDKTVDSVIKNKKLEEHRDELLAGDYLCMEHAGAKTKQATGRELWRLSARTAALGDPEESIDYGELVAELQQAVDPVLVAYQQRDQIVAALHAAGKRLDGAQLCILYRTPGDEPAPGSGTQESVLANLLQRSGLQPQTLPNGRQVKALSSFNLALLDANEDNPQYLDAAITALSEQAALVLVSAGSDPTAKQLADGGLQVIDVSDLPVENDFAEAALSEGDAPRPVRAVYAGLAPLVDKTQRQLLMSLRQGILWAAILIAVIMMFFLQGVMAGVVSMIPNIFPIIVIFGGLGLLNIKVGIGIMLAASVALGVAVGDTIHLLTWFRRGVAQGLDRVQAVWLALDRCATAMMQTTLIGGLGLAVFAASTVRPTQEFGVMAILMLGAALVGDLLILPALLVSPLGRLFGAAAQAKIAVPARLPEQRPPVLEPVLELVLEPVPEPVLEFVLEPVPEPVLLADYQPVPPTKKKELVGAAMGSAALTEQEKQELRSGPHAALHAKLRSLRRELPEGPVSS